MDMEGNLWKIKYTKGGDPKKILIAIAAIEEQYWGPVSDKKWEIVVCAGRKKYVAVMAIIGIMLQTANNHTVTVEQLVAEIHYKNELKEKSNQEQW